MEVNVRCLRGKALHPVVGIFLVRFSTRLEYEDNTFVFAPNFSRAEVKHLQFFPSTHKKQIFS